MIEPFTTSSLIAMPPAAWPNAMNLAVRSLIVDVLPPNRSMQPATSFAAQRFLEMSVNPCLKVGIVLKSTRLRAKHLLRLMFLGVRVSQPVEQIFVRMAVTAPSLLERTGPALALRPGSGHQVPHAPTVTPAGTR
jgi:hypothetical protein